MNIQEPPHDLDAEKAVLGACMDDTAVVHEVRKTLPDPALFFRPAHQTIYQALLTLADEWAPTDPLALSDHLDRAGLLNRVGGRLYLFEALQHGHIVANLNFVHHAQTVARHARRRAAQEAVTRAMQRLQHDDEDAVDEILTDARNVLDKAAQDVAYTRPRRILTELDDFLNAPEDEYDWLIPGLLERGDRLMLTGPEGGGKSTLWRQMAVQAASGIHPFTGEPIAPLRVLHLDLENSERQSRRKLRPLRVQAGDAYQPGQLIVEVRPAGLDLLTRDDNAWLDELVIEARPDILLTGPLYRMASGDPTEEKHAKAVSEALDRIRNRGSAILVETHCPHATAGGKRPERPYGASMWLRWPEFGLYLAEDGAVRPWRGARDERDFPHLLKRGGEWPWTAVTDKKMLDWARIRECRTQFNSPMTIRDVADTTGIPKSTVARILKENQLEWDALNGMSLERVG